MSSGGAPSRPRTWTSSQSRFSSRMLDRFPYPSVKDEPQRYALPLYRILRPESSTRSGLPAGVADAPTGWRLLCASISSLKPPFSQSALRSEHGCDGDQPPLGQAEVGRSLRRCGLCSLSMGRVCYLRWWCSFRRVLWVSRRSRAGMPSRDPGFGLVACPAMQLPRDVVLQQFGGGCWSGWFITAVFHRTRCLQYRRLMR